MDPCLIWGQSVEVELSLELAHGADVELLSNDCVPMRTVFQHCCFSNDLHCFQVEMIGSGLVVVVETVTILYVETMGPGRKVGVESVATDELASVVIDDAGLARQEMI